MGVILATITNTRLKSPNSPPLRVKGLVETAAPRQQWREGLWMRLLVLVQLKANRLKVKVEIIQTKCRDRYCLLRSPLQWRPVCCKFHYCPTRMAFAPFLVGRCSHHREHSWTWREERYRSSKYRTQRRADRTRGDILQVANRVICCSTCWVAGDGFVNNIGEEEGTYNFHQCLIRMKNTRKRSGLLFGFRGTTRIDSISLQAFFIGLARACHLF